ncbi:DNA-3-methyladenine glycosylase family protein [Pedobacter sp. GR22-10]|uniref:DNA-3-methyladenine glycosylase family protein n=1 Tax=Pedobacter sp. GR22-10 TaxID=2994472 RepID=UPI002246D0DE|nr:DNA-3-methyladenine glycosylase 2 family protein [Pedobacter sp. GR22-10]MCX2429833.1 DNA-3-methyladenine glycosylase 2 family protein [Pedobacter sp. GR22-10]
MPGFKVFDIDNYHALCNTLAAQDPDLNHVLMKYGYPPFWSRANTFESLVHIILEQQVSLASALAALNKLKAKIGEIDPVAFLRLTDEELKACYFSRQKTVYVRDLAQKIINGELSLAILASLSADEIRLQLKRVKGVGDWTVDIYLLFILHHSDIFPLGDLAAVNALKNLKNLPKDTSKEELSAIATQWKPYRTIAVMILWHFYLEEPKIKGAIAKC